MRTTKKDVQRAKRLAKRRFKYMLKKYPTTLDKVELDETYINSLSPKKAVEYLNSISSKNINNNSMWKGIKITISGTNLFNKTKINEEVKGPVLRRKIFEAESELVKAYHSIGMNAPKTNFMGQPTKNLFTKYYEKYNDPIKILNAKKVREDHAFTNYINNLRQMRDYASNEEERELFRIIVELIEEKIDKGELSASDLNDKGLFEYSGVNLFDSGGQNKKGRKSKSASSHLDRLKSNAGKILKQLRTEIGITDDEIYRIVYPIWHDKIYEEVLNTYYKHVTKLDLEENPELEEKLHNAIENKVEEIIRRKIDELGR